MSTLTTDQDTAARGTIRLSERREPQDAAPRTPVRRQFVNFTFYRVRPEWRMLSSDEKQAARTQYAEVFRSFRPGLLLHTYSLVGLRTNADFMTWRIGYELDPVQTMSAQLNATKLGAYLTTTQSFLSMTKRSTYIDKEHPTHVEDRLHIMPGQSKYLFVYPFVKTRPWYMLSLDERQEMMDEHIRVGSKYTSVKLHTTYSFGLDDQEFVVAFETDDPSDFLDLVQELRETKASSFTLRDTPMYTCRQQTLEDCLIALG